MPVLGVAPVFDDVTEHSVEWAEEIFDETPDREITVLKNRPIEREEVMENWDDKNLLVVYSHGSKDALWGSHDEAIVDTRNIDEAPETIYTMACLCAKVLGVEAWKTDRCFWGYTKSFAFTTKDEELFKEFANHGYRLHLAGDSFKEAIEKTREYGNRLIDQLTEAGSFISSAAMYQDVNSLVYYDGEHPGETDCMFRHTAIHLWGAKAWFIERLRAMNWLLFGVGSGITIHAVARELLDKGGVSEVLSLQGEWFGLALMMYAFARNEYMHLKKIGELIRNRLAGD